MVSIDRDIFHIFRNSSRCDGYFFADISVGETFTGTDGTSLTYASDNETVDTPAGRFEGCQLWITRHWNDNGKSVYKSYYKDGVGIVKHEHTIDSTSAVCLLKSYKIKGGKGFLPLVEGNTWEYSFEYDPEVVACEQEYTVAYADDKKIIVSHFETAERFKYDENSWLDMIEQIRNEYWIKKDNKHCINDVSTAIERAEKLASTPMEKAHTNAAASVARRIMETNPKFNPNYTATGHWNFFSKNVVQKKKDTLYVSRNYRWSFELKYSGSMEVSETPILFNDVYEILQDATNCLWSDEWRVGASTIVEYTKWDRNVKTFIKCEDGGTITTKAGTFENCFKLSLDIGGMSSGVTYRGGKKVYYFAEGIGIVRIEHEYFHGIRMSVYELTSYEGTGEGYMPMADGLMRRYDALDLSDGFAASAVYTYVADEDGDIVIFTDRTGIRELPPHTTQYASIRGEVLESEIMDSGDWKGAQLQHGINNANLLVHYLSRPSRNKMTAKRSVELMKFNKNLIRTLGEGEVPDGFCALYSWHSLIEAAAHVGNQEKEAAYDCLEEALSYAERWHGFDDGSELSLGNEYVLSGARYVKGKEQFVFNDERREPAAYTYRLDPYAGLIYNVLTMPRGWEWFNGIRNEERFKKYIERARTLKEKYDK